jgi:hypothetical protein
MTASGNEPPTTDEEIALALLELARSRHLSAGTKTTLRLAAERLQQTGPIYSHVVRTSQRYEVIYPAAQVQCAEPIKEGDQVTVYVSLEDGEAWVRPHDEFLRRFNPAP